MGSDGTGKDITVLMGAGVFDSQAEIAFKLIENNPILLEYFSLATSSFIDPKIQLKINSLIQNENWAIEKTGKELFRPSFSRSENSHLIQFIRYLIDNENAGLPYQFFFDNIKENEKELFVIGGHSFYQLIHSWSVRNLQFFWSSFWNWLKIPFFVFLLLLIIIIIIIILLLLLFYYYFYYYYYLSSNYFNKITIKY